jgi:hypothetical protein
LPAAHRPTNLIVDFETTQLMFSSRRSPPDTDTSLERRTGVLLRIRGFLLAKFSVRMISENLQVLWDAMQCPRIPKRLRYASRYPGTDLILRYEVKSRP